MKSKTKGIFWQLLKYRRWTRQKWYRLYLKRVRMVEREIGEDLAVCG